jgi:AAA+ ATPase superfamily predicted ATPase
MKFYNREKELELLENTRKSAEESSKMTIVTGRRRIGKTSLILKSVENHSFIYFFPDFTHKSNQKFSAINKIKGLGGVKIFFYL